MSVILDTIIIVMLGMTIFYAARLNGKLAIIRSQKDALAKNLEAFSKATDTAINAVEELQVKGEKICRQIEDKIKKGHVLADDIEFLIDRASKRMKDFESKDNESAKRQKLGGYSETELVNLLRQKQKQAAYAN